MKGRSVDLLIASTNQKKLKEMQHLLADLSVRLFSLKDFSDITEVEETGATFEENAKLKALGYAKQTKMMTLAEDSGLCCDSLEGAPGVHSARFSGENRSDEDNNAKLLRLMETMPDNCRTAHYTSVIALAEPDRVIGTVDGRVEGYITRELKGSNGFGYDPLFFYPPFDKTFGEVSQDKKNAVSHRSKALDKIRSVLMEHLSGKMIG